MRKVYRTRQGRMLGGVCIGIAHYFNIDVTLVRLIWVAVALIRGAGILAYIVAWIVIPDESGTDKTIDIPSSGDKHPADKRTLGLILIIIGVFLLILKTIPALISRFFWPLLLVAIGLFIMFGGFRGDRT